MKKTKKAVVKANDTFLVHALKWYFGQVSDGWRIFLKLVAFYSGVMLVAIIVTFVLSILLLLL